MWPRRACEMKQPSCSKIWMVSSSGTPETARGWSHVIIIQVKKRWFAARPYPTRGFRKRFKLLPSHSDQALKQLSVYKHWGKRLPVCSINLPSTKQLGTSSKYVQVTSIILHFLAVIGGCIPLTPPLCRGVSSVVSYASIQYNTVLVSYRWVCLVATPANLLVQMCFHQSNSHTRSCPHPYVKDDVRSYFEGHLMCNTHLCSS